MRIIWTPHAWDEYVEWQASDPKLAQSINELIAEIRRSPFTGTGKPEPLKGELSGWWARRITKEHRFVYRVAGKRGIDQHMIILQCRFHYFDK